MYNANTSLETHVVASKNSKYVKGVANSIFTNRPHPLTLYVLTQISIVKRTHTVYLGICYLELNSQRTRIWIHSNLRTLISSSE